MTPAFDVPIEVMSVENLIQSRVRAIDRVDF